MRSRFAGVRVLFAVGHVLPQLAGAEALVTKWARPQSTRPSACAPRDAAMRRLDPFVRKCLITVRASFIPLGRRRGPAPWSRSTSRH